MREKLIKVRLSDEEYKRAVEAADIVGAKLAAWARSAVLVTAQNQKARAETEVDL